MEESTSLDELLSQLVSAITAGDWMALIPIVLTIIGVVIAIVVKSKKKTPPAPPSETPK